MAVDSRGSVVTPRSMIPPGDWLPTVWCCGVIDSPQYDTPGRHTQCSIYIILWGDFDEKFDQIGQILTKITQYDTPGRYKKIGITRRNPKIVNILTHWSAAHAGSNDETNGGRKSRWTVSLAPSYRVETAEKNTQFAWHPTHRQDLAVRVSKQLDSTGRTRDKTETRHRGAQLQGCSLDRMCE